MLSSKVSLLSVTILLSSLLLMRWLTSEERWWSGFGVLIMISVYFAPMAVKRFQTQFLDAVENGRRVKAVVAALKMLLWGNGCFLMAAFAYYVVLALAVSISKMSIHLDGWIYMGIQFLNKLWGLLLVGILYVPVVCLVALYIYRRCASAVKNATESTGNASTN